MFLFKFLIGFFYFLSDRFKAMFSVVINGIMANVNPMLFECPKYLIITNILSKHKDLACMQDKKCVMNLF